MTNAVPEGGPDDLERRLAQLRTDLVFPATPDFAAVFAVDSAGPFIPSGRALTNVSRPFWKVLAVAAIAIGIVAFALPGTRATLASWFDFAGIRIEIGTDDRTLQSPPTTIGGSLLLGPAVSIEDAAAVARFEIVALADDGIVGEAETYLLERDGTVMVSLLYPPSAELPEVGTTGVGLLLMQIDSPGSDDFLVKLVMNESPPVSVSVNGNDGAWVEGGTLTIEPVHQSGVFGRSSGNVLIWEENGVTYRMESSLTLPEALAIAESLRPIAPAEASSQSTLRASLGASS